ncbi:hypothetical protein AMEX_G17218 [Astyanax mexicanus]|nr:hypothetical protein AMEX_G17218 [Astyanax mexicanus]
MPVFKISFFSLPGNPDTGFYAHVANELCPGQWTEVTLGDFQNAPLQWGGIDCGLFILMYALYVVMELPFDFTQTDMPDVRRWWCLQLLETFPVGSKVAAASMEDVKSRQTPAQQNSSPPESFEDSPMMKNIVAAAEWVKTNSHSLKGRVLLPKVLDMEKEDALLALATYQLFQDECSDLEEIWQPFVFMFELQDDMELFLSEVRDKINIRVSAVIDLSL